MSKHAETAEDFDRRFDILDIETPRNTPLCGRFKKSFAYYTLRERLPVILTTVLDNLTKDKDNLVEKYSEDSREEIKSIIGQISELKYRLQTDKPLEEFTGNEPDKELWNNFISKLPENANTFFSTCWLYAECYMYRRLWSFFENSVYLKDHDYFENQKRNGANICTDEMEVISKAMLKMYLSEENFIHLLKLQLWGNRCDMSITVGREVRPNADTLGIMDSLDPMILIDKTKHVWQCMNHAGKVAQNKNIIVDIVLDNAGFELFTDLVFADFLIEQKMAQQVRFHVKAIPWFISDVRHGDFEWMLNYFSERGQPCTKELARKWRSFVSAGKFFVHPVHPFWTSPYEYYRMREVAPELYKTLGEAYLVIFKGDLNYRKIIGDYSWDYSEDFLTCLRGFLPTHLCTLRTVKADLICGLREDQALELFKTKPDWMVTGEYGTVQFAENTNCNAC